MIVLYIFSCVAPAHFLVWKQKDGNIRREGVLGEILTPLEAVNSWNSSAGLPSKQG